jgi:hypothetical protein
LRPFVEFIFEERDGETEEGKQLHEVEVGKDTKKFRKDFIDV